VITCCSHFSLWWATWIHFTPHVSLSIKSFLILSSHVCLCFSSHLLQIFRPMFFTRFLYFSCMLRDPPSHPPCLVRSESCKILHYVHCIVTFTLLCPDILLGILFSYILNLCSFLNVRDQFSNLYKITDKSIILNSVNFEFYSQAQRSRGLSCVWSWIFRTLG
jgi:hypothetical protein